MPALRKLIASNTPHIFVTNGGGISEDLKAQQLSEKLDIDILPSQILLSHTPLRKQVENFMNKPILVVGSRHCAHVAKEYGFNQIVTVQDIHESYVEVYPGRKASVDENGAGSLPKPSQQQMQSIAAAMVFHDPVDWGLEMQVLSDVLLGHIYPLPCADATSSTVRLQQIPLFACNADLVYMDQYATPRYTQGAFIEAFRAIFENYTESKLDVTYCGKPFLVQYTYAEEMLNLERRRLLGLPAVAAAATTDLSPMRYFGIGDNPKADIRGANGAGSHWTSILVKTGIYQDGCSRLCDNDVPDILLNDVSEAVDHICNVAEAEAATS